MNIKLTTYIIVLLALLSACTNVENDVDVTVFPGDENWKEELLDGPSATVKRFEPGDETSRTTLYYDGQGLVFGWKGGDRIGLYPTAKDMTTAGEDQSEYAGLLSQTDFPHPSLTDEPKMYRVDPQFASPTPFSCNETTSQTTRIINGSAAFFWDDIVRWSAYFPYSQGKEEENYEKRYFSFKGQIQGALAEIGEYFDYEDATTQEEKNQHLSKYQWSESKACKHLGDYDVMISPETKWEDGVRINFQMRHVGAIARVYLKAMEEGLVIKDVKLICDKPIFYEDGSFNLISHPYKATETNYGVDLNRKSTGCQIKPEGDAVNMIKLDFATSCVTKKSGNGWGPYVVAYFMMYPITYTPATDGNLFAYVTAYRQGDSPSNEVHYVSQPLSAKTMESGKYYQWSSATHPDDGLYPIELTATLLPWQEIVGSGIETDLEK